MAVRAPIIGPVVGLSSHASLNIPEAATQTFKQGAVIVTSAGYAQEAGVDPSAIVGVAAMPGSNLDTAGVAKGAYDGACRMIPALPHSQFEFTLDSAAGTPYASLATDMGAAYGLTKDANGLWYVDVDKTGGQAAVNVVGFRDPVGTAQARVYVAFRGGKTIFQ